mmetsp:Transcript_70304/g.205607  ORF Transcript_70304/g.205607 Transcript_70304/m.205607 type:complete len:236 (-) Transcript_70304:13-720(-)
MPIPMQDASRACSWGLAQGALLMRADPVHTGERPSSAHVGLAVQRNRRQRRRGGPLSLPQPLADLRARDELPIRVPRRSMAATVLTKLEDRARLAALCQPLLRRGPRGRREGGRQLRGRGLQQVAVEAHQPGYLRNRAAAPQQHGRRGPSWRRGRGSGRPPTHSLQGHLHAALPPRPGPRRGRGAREAEHLPGHVYVHDLGAGVLVAAATTASAQREAMAHGPAPRGGWREGLMG